MSKDSTNKATKLARFLLSGVRVFLKNTELAQMMIQNEYGAISVVRDIPPQQSTHAIGFDCGNIATDDD